MTFLVCLVSILVLIAVVNYMQANHFESLPPLLKTWEFLPLFMRSLKPYDDFIVKYLCFGRMCKKIIATTNDKPIFSNKNDEKVVVFTNNAYTIESF